MSGHRLSNLVSLFGMLEGLPRVLVSGLIFRFPLLFARAMGVGGEIVQLGGALMIFVMRSIVIALRHYALWTPTDHAGFAK